jgi:hypothetical protein
MAQAFEDDWKHRAVPLATEQVVEYENGRPEVQKLESYTKGQLAKILGVSSSHRQATEDDQDRDFWRDFITGFVKKRTERIISETTNWDDRNYEWYSAWWRSPLQNPRPHRSVRIP